MQRKLNGLMVLFSLIGGALGFILGEYVLHRWYGEWPTAVVVGLYMGILALCIGLFCLIAEMVSPRLSGASWRQQYTGLSWKLIVPATLVMLLLIGSSLEFVYQLHVGGTKQVKDIVLVIDNSGSMNQNDPHDDRYEAAKSLIQTMDKDKRVALVTFSDHAQVVQPFAATDGQQAKDALTQKIDTMEKTDGGTNIEGALSEVMTLIQNQGDTNRGTMAILLSDGFSHVDTHAALAGYNELGIQVNTIGLSLVDPSGAGLLQQIADYTGGQYYDVAQADELSLVFENIYSKLGDRSLLTARSDETSSSPYYMIVRLVSFVILGIALGVALGIVFDNRYLARSFAAGGAAAGLLAGVLLEFGLTGQGWIDVFVRLAAVLILAAVLTLFTVVIPIKENGGGLYRQKRQASSLRRGAEDFAEQPRNRTNRGF